MRVARTFVLSIFYAVSAHAAAPTIVNNSSQNAWLETSSLARNARNAVVTLLVRHDPNVNVTGLVVDVNYDGTDNTPALGPTAFGSVERLTGSFIYSRITATFQLPDPGGWSCPIFASGTRRLDRPVRVAVMDSTGQRSASVSGNIHFVENTNCTNLADYPRVFNQTQNVITATPSQSVFFTFTADDPDPNVFSGDDSAGAIDYRLRNLIDGSIAASGLLTSGADDNVSRSINIAMPRRGRWVLEGRVRNENSTFPDPNAWWRLGAVDVNSSTPPSISLSGPTSVNVGQIATITANVSDSADSATSGRVQIIEWDGDGNGTFERREITTETQNVGGAMVQQTVNTSTFGLRNVSARAFDNGAISGADNIRRSSTNSRLIRVNAIPIANNQTVGGAEDSPRPIVLIGNDPDGQPAPLRYEIVSQPSRGTLSCFAQNCSYSPQANFNGSDSFTFRVADGTTSTIDAWSFSNTATVTINVTPVNDPPVVSNRSLSTDENTPVPFSLTATDVDNTAFTFAVATQPAHGTVSCSASGACTYTPEENYSGPDSLTYTASDGSATSAPATVTFEIAAVDNSPVANDVAINTDEDTAVTFTPPVTDPDSPALTLVANDPAHGSVTCGAATCTYTPDADFFGEDTFTYRATDPEGGFDEGTVTVTVAPVNDPPVASPVAVTTDEDTAATLAVPVTDVDDAALTLTPSDPDHGDATCSGNECTYTPDLNFFGTDSFNILATDAAGASAISSVSVTVNAVNDPPVADDIAIETDEDTAVTFALPANDVEGPVTLAADDPAHGTVSCGIATCTYEPDANFFGSDSFNYTATDTDGVATNASITVNVRPVNDPPVAEDAAASTDEDTPVDVTIPAADVDDVDLTYTVVNGPAHGTVSCALSTCTYTPNANYSGGDSFTVLVSDGRASDPSQVAITVSPVNDAPVADDVPITTDEDTEVTFTPPASDVDAEPLALTASDPDHGSATCGNGTCTYTPDANFFGTDSFTYTASDGDLSDTGLVTVTVNAVNDRPVISCSGNISRNTDAGLCSASVNAPATANDVEDGTLAPACTASSPFALGSTTVECSVTDAGGLEASCSYSVTVTDAEPPSITAPAGIVTSTNETCSATITNLGNATATDACGTANVTRSGVPAGNSFPIGITTITYTATDGAGNNASATQTVEVRDETLPVASASLTGVGKVQKNHGDFRVNFSANDECGLSSTVAVMAVPDSVRSFTVRSTNGGPKTTIRIDLNRGEISVAGNNIVEKTRLLAEIMSLGGIRVANDQVIRIDSDKNWREIEFRFDNGVLERMQAPEPELRVIATDVHGNVALATATAEFAK